MPVPYLISTAVVTPHPQSDAAEITISYGDKGNEVSGALRHAQQSTLSKLHAHPVNPKPLFYG